MATVEQLLVELRADARQYEKAMSRMVSQTEAQTARLNNQFSSAQRQIDKFMKDSQSSLNKGLTLPGLTGGIAGIAGALSTKVIADYADAWTEAGNKIAATGIGKDQAVAAREEIASIATRARTDFGATADLYARLTRAGQGFGASQGEVAIATETVAKALKVTGASASETESTLIQLGQALTSGRLQGDELRSLSENAPVVAASIAKAFGVTVGQLKELGAQGVLTSDKVFRAIVDAQADVDKAFATTTGTIKDGFKALETAAIRYVGASNTVGGTSEIAARALGALASNIEIVAAGAMALGAVLATRLLAAGLTPVIASFSAAASSSLLATGSMNAFSAAAGRASTAAATLGIASRAASGAMALLGGPVGAALFGLVTVFTVLANRQAAGSDASRIYAAALADVETQANRTKPAIEGVTNAVDKKTQALRAAAEAAHNNNLKTFEADARNLETTIRGAVQSIEQFGAVRVSNGDKEQALAAIKAALDGDGQSAIDAKVKLEELGATNPSFSAAFAKLNGLMTALAATRQSIAATSNQLAALGAQQAADGERQRAASDQAALFKAGVGQVGAPAGPDPAFKKLELQREIALSMVDDTKKRIDAKAKELYEKDRALGQALSLSEYAKAAGEIIANEDSGKGGKGKKGGSKEEPNDSYDNALINIRKQIELQQLEQQLVGKTAEEVTKAKTAHDLLAAAKQAERDITPGLNAEIEREAAAYAAAEAAARKHKEALEETRQLQQFIGTSLSGFFSDIISGGKNASDALMNLAKKLADAALQAALLGQGPLAALFGTASGEKGVAGGIIGALVKGFSSGFAEGGYTGAGGKYQPAGVVHAGEYVMPQEVVKRLGVGNLAALHKGALKGYANGGFVGGSAPILSNMAQASAPSAAVSISIDARGATVDAVAGIKLEMAKLQRSLPGIIMDTQRQARLRGAF